MVCDTEAKREREMYPVVTTIIRPRKKTAEVGIPTGKFLITNPVHYQLYLAMTI